MVPTYGISLVVLFAYLYFSMGNPKDKVEKGIICLSEDSSPLGTHLEGLHYAQVLAYADEYARITHTSGQYVEFNVMIDGSKYLVTLNREPNGNGAILNSEKGN